MIAATLLADGLFTTAQRAVNSPYPPSFDNNPWIFGWALFARLLVCLLAAATIVRVHVRNSAEGLPANHPVYYHRMVTLCFLTGAMMGSGSDVITYLLWNETTEYVTTLVMLFARILDALTMFPFLGALFVTTWLRWFRYAGLVKTSPSIVLNGVINDVRVTWPDAVIPAKLLAYSAAIAIMVTAGKYFLWVEHGHLR